MSNTFRQNETVVIDAEVTSINTSISNVNITITDQNGLGIAVPKTVMQDIGGYQYRYFWDTTIGYTGYSQWVICSGISGYTGYSCYSGTSGYSAYVSGVYNVEIEARDAYNHYGYEEFKIRIK